MENYQTDLLLSLTCVFGRQRFEVSKPLVTLDIRNRHFMFSFSSLRIDQLLSNFTNVLESKEKGNDQELIQLNPTPHPQEVHK